MAQGHLLAPVVTIFLLLLEGFTATYAALVSTAVVMYAWLLGRWVWPLLAAGIVLWVSTRPWALVILAAVGLFGACAARGRRAAAQAGGPRRPRRARDGA